MIFNPMCLATHRERNESTMLCIDQEPAANLTIVDGPASHASINMLAINSNEDGTSNFIFLTSSV